jgi:hypothetical protein
MDWTNLRQMAAEDPLGFPNWVAGILYPDQKLLGTRLAPEREREALSAVIKTPHQADAGTGTRAQIKVI